MKAVLKVQIGTDSAGKPKYEMMLFDTEKAKQICVKKNCFGYIYEIYYMSERKVFFKQNTNTRKLSVPDQKQVREWIGEEYPEVYVKIFGEVQEA